MDSEKIGIFIKNLREEKNLTQEELANKIPIGREAISKWENGRRLPEITTLQKVAEIFDVSIEEILTGERNPEKNITIELYNDRNKKVKILKLLLVTILVLIFSFLTYYFISQYRSVKIYSVAGSSENFKIFNGLFIKTNEKLYFNIGQIIKQNKDIKIDYLRLYYDDGKTNELICYTTDEIISLTDYNGYNEFFADKKVKNLNNNLYLEIGYDNNKEIIKLKFSKDYENSHLFLKKSSNISENSNSKLLKDANDSESVIEKIKNKFKKIDDGYVWNNDNVTFNYLDDTNILYLTIIDKNQREQYFYDLNYHFLDYYNYQNEKLNYSFSYDLTFNCLSGTCDEKEMNNKKDYFFKLYNSVLK